MEVIIDQLKQWLVISVSDLLKIRNYISQKYMKSSKKKRAEILSNTVHQVLDSHLEGVDQEYKNALKYSILSSTIGHNNYDITKFDIFKSIFELDIPSSTQISLASAWIDKSTELDLDASDILEFVVAYSEGNDQKFVPETLVENYSDFQIRSNFNVKKKNPVFDFVSHYLLNTEFIFTFFIITIIAITLRSAIIRSLPKADDMPRTISIERNIVLKDNPFLTNHLFLMKTVRVSHIDDQSEILIIYEPSKYAKNPYAYERFDFIALKSYLLNIKQSYIGEAPYLNAIVNIAKLNDIDPLLLISIIGQEQNFVPLSNSERQQIINNPYNVYYSWKNYNTTLSDSTQIAINTIKNSFSKMATPDMDHLEWLNQTYAEDQNWHKGVREIYAFLDDLCRQ